MGLLTIAAPLSALTGAAAAPLPRESAIKMPVREESGTIWSVAGDDSDVLQRWTGKAWLKTGFAPHPNAYVFSLQKRSDGKVMALWKQPAKDGVSAAEYFLSVHHDGASQTLNQFQLRPPVTDSGSALANYGMIQSFTAPENSLWLVGEGRDFYRVSGEGLTQKLFVLPRTTLEEAPLEAGQTPSSSVNSAYLPQFDSLLDDRGRTWFWTNAWKNHRRAPRLRGFLTAEKGGTTEAALTLRPTLPGLPPSALPEVQALTSDGRSHLYLALRSNGVYEINTTTLRASRIAAPFRGAFNMVRQIWPDSNANKEGRERDLYVVAGALNSDKDTSNHITDLARRLRRNSLWRRRAGHWKLLVAGLDKYNSDEIQASRSFLRTSEGLWLGANGDGLWFVGRDDRAHLVSWQRGFNLPLRQSLFPLPNTAHPDGAASRSKAAPPPFLATSNDGTTIVPGFAPLSKATGAPGVSTFVPFFDPIQDVNLHLWAVLNLRDHALHEWDGTRWKKHLTPSNYQLSYGSEVALDGRGRIWIPSDARESTSAIFDPQSGKWQIFPSYAAALLANRNGALPIANRNDTSEWRGPSGLPRRSPGGRLCFLSFARKIYLFDGKRWRSWKRREIEELYRQEWFDNPPFFGAKGQLCVQLYRDVYELTSNGWKITTHETDPDFKARHLSATYLGGFGDLPKIPLQRSRSDREETSYWDNGIRDTEGTLWLFKNRALYRAPGAPLPRVTRLLLSVDQNQPFQDGRIPQTIFVDARGNVFFGTNWGEWVMLRNDAPLPDTFVQLERQSSGSFVAHFGASRQKSAAQLVTSKFGGWFSWRLDKKAWNEPTLQSSLEMDLLAPGRHEIEVLALSAAGRPDPTPARVTWTVKADTPAQLQQLIQQLRDPHFAQREAAIRVLSRQSAFSLPPLRAALETARQKSLADQSGETEVTWWLEAAIQEAERSH